MIAFVARWCLALVYWLCICTIASRPLRLCSSSSNSSRQGPIMQGPVSARGAKPAPVSCDATQQCTEYEYSYVRVTNSYCYQQDVRVPLRSRRMQSSVLLPRTKVP